MIRIRRAEERGHADHGWLRTSHTFSFADYHDPRWMRYRTLRVINEDRVAPETGFPMHSHRDMEILTYVLEGAVLHEDNLGNRGVVRAGHVQRMTAGRGITHSETNPSEDEVLHLLQVWILPEVQDLDPGYEQRSFPAGEKRGRLCRIASATGRDGALLVHQDAEVFASVLEPAERVRHEPRPGRGAWLQVARGAVSVLGADLRAGDGAAIEEEGAFEIEGTAPNTELLLFDLA